MRTFTFKVYPDPQGPSNSKASSNPQAEGKPAIPPPGGSCPPPPDCAPIAPPPDCVPIAPPPPMGQIPSFQPILPFEQMPPFEPIGPISPYPFCGPLPFPGSQPMEPVLPGYAINPCLAHAYVPWQFYSSEYPPSEALDNGTMFPELNQPQGEYGPCEGPQPCKLVFPRGGASDEAY